MGSQGRHQVWPGQALREQPSQLWWQKQQLWRQRLQRRRPSPTLRPALRRRRLRCLPRRSRAGRGAPAYCARWDGAADGATAWCSDHGTAEGEVAVLQASVPIPHWLPAALRSSRQARPVARPLVQVPGCGAELVNEKGELVGGWLAGGLAEHGCLSVFSRPLYSNVPIFEFSWG